MITVIIPSLHTAYLKPLVSAIKKNLPCSHEILIQSEKGYLKAVLRGVEKAKGDVLIIMDGDGSHNPVHFRQMFQLLSKADIVVGSRYVPGGFSNDIFLRRIISRFFCKLTRFVLDLNIADVMSGFIVLRKSTLKSININAFGYKIGLDILMQAKGKFSVLECPIVFRKSRMGDYVKLRNIKDGVQTLTFIAKLFICRVSLVSTHKIA